MTLPLLVRPMLQSERAMVLSDWKRGLWDERPSWGRALHSDEWWSLVNFVMDAITLPSCEVRMICHTDEGSVPLGWAAMRAGRVLRLHAKASVQASPELAARLERKLLESVASPVAETFNPFMELRR